MTTQDLERMKAYCDKAASGPLVLSKQYDFLFVLNQQNEILWSGRQDRDEDNMQFFIQSRTDLPACLAEIETLRAANSGANQMIGAQADENDRTCLALKAEIERLNRNLDDELTLRDILAAALIVSHSQWFHSVNKDHCLDALAKYKAANRYPLTSNEL